MATKSTPDPKAIADETTKVVEDMMTKAQDQYLALLAESQSVVIESYEAVAGTVAKMNLPTVPGIGELYQVPVTAFDKMFDFGSAVIENQKAFTKKVLEVSQG